MSFSHPCQLSPHYPKQKRENHTNAEQKLDDRGSEKAEYAPPPRSKRLAEILSSKPELSGCRAKEDSQDEPGKIEREESYDPSNNRANRTPPARTEARGTIRAREKIKNNRKNRRHSQDNQGDEADLLSTDKNRMDQDAGKDKPDTRQNGYNGSYEPHNHECSRDDVYNESFHMGSVYIME